MERITKPITSARILVASFGLLAALLVAAFAAPGAAFADSAAPASPASAGSDVAGALTTSATPDAPSFGNTADAVDYVREQLIARKTTIVLQVDSGSLGETSASRIAYCQGLVDKAIAHTGDPKGGDYLRWQMSSYETSITTGLDKSTLTYTVEYYSNAEQEEAVDRKVSQIVTDLGLKNLGEYDRIVAIYKYITSNVAYDYENLNDKSYTAKYSAYAALFDGKAVCQGVATLFYRLAWESGLQARVVSGKVKENEDHAWNIVCLAGKYYNLDCTWDLGATPGKYRYLLKCNASFSDHVWDDESANIAKDYSMATSDYKDPATSGTAIQRITLPKMVYSKAYGSKSFNLKAATSGDGVLTYSSSNTKVATVDSKGTVTIKGVGEAGISVYAAASSTYAKSAVTRVIVKVVKGANTLSVKGKTATVKRSVVKAKNKVLKRSAVLTVSKAKGTVTYAKVSGNKKIVINKKTGKVTVKKGLAKGTYKVKVKVKAAGTSKYKARTKKATFKIKVA